MKINRISEATGSGNVGTFKVPIVLAPQDWKDEQLAPFNNPVYHYTNAELAYEESDGDFKETPEQRKKIENKTELLSRIDTYLKNFYTGQNDEDGGNIGDVKNPEKIIQRAIGTLKEDLAVWFGTKKKPKGSKQPQGPWVNICRKKEGGGHPECGRSDSDKGGYPVCRAKSVAANMSQESKDSACRRKREREKTDGKSGKGQTPSPIKVKNYKSKKNESLNYDRMLITENRTIISEGLRYHIDNEIPLTESVYRYGSESFFNLINEVRELHVKGKIDLSFSDEEIIRTDIGKQGIYEGRKVWLDIPNEYMEINEAEYKGKTVELSKPKRGGSKKFYVYVMCNGKVKKVSFGAKSGGANLSVKLRDSKAKKAFSDRHNCPQKNDKCSAGYWSCRLPRYAKQLGLSGGGTWW